jgi:hypothetical protein
MRQLLEYLEGPALQVMDDLRPAERTLVERELELLRREKPSGSTIDQLRRLVRAAPERLYRFR